MRLKVDIREQQIMRKIKLEAERQYRLKVSRALREGFDVLMDQTPVWSAETIGNYRFGIGERPLDFDPVLESWRNFFTKEPDIDSAVSASRSSMEQAVLKLQVMDDPLDDPVWVVNNIVYDGGEDITALEFGEIGRQPYYMMTQAADAMEAIMEVRL